MSYMPKTVRCKLNFKNATDEDIRKTCSCASEVEGVRKFYEKVDGIELYLGLWSYDNYENYHLSSWADKVDKTMMDAFWIFEQAFGVYEDYEKFQRDWHDGEYDCGGSIVFDKKFVEELEVIHEESNKLSNRERIDLINSIKVIEASASLGEIEYILVEDNQNNRDILHKIGVTNDDIKEKCNPQDGELDIVVVGFEIANFYDMKKKAFFNED